MAPLGSTTRSPRALTRVRLDGDRRTVLEQRSVRTGLRSDLNHAVQAVTATARSG
ncbi:MAG: hypothetical protein IPL96_17865 [Holophagaceae bacterium]|nr:hypothetical protein [Holophagaceae bacterium]